MRVDVVLEVGAASDSVTVTALDLTATKTDSVGGHAVFPNPWTWKIHVSNGGNVSGSFASGKTILSDNLPNSTITYGPPSVSNAVSVTNSSAINCSITGSDLTCTASGATVTMSPAPAAGPWADRQR